MRDPLIASASPAYGRGVFSLQGRRAMQALPDPEAQPEFYESVPLKRLLAWVIDVGVIALASVLIVPFTAFAGLFFFPLLMLVVGFVYRVATIASGSGTWGMRLMGIELRTGGDRRFDLGFAMLHTTGYALSIAVPVVQLASIVLMCTTPHRQGLTDLALNTTALKRRRLRRV